jgi:hypothetical protein
MRLTIIPGNPPLWAVSQPDGVGKTTNCFFLRSLVLEFTTVRKRTQQHRISPECRGKDMTIF